MTATRTSLFELTAGDLMSRELITICVDQPLVDAARQLAKARIHGAPVVDETGRCVGVLSVTDLARWAVNQAAPAEPRPSRAYSFQERRREPGGRESILCTLPAGACLLQRQRQGSGERPEATCAEPYGVCVDWQVLEVEGLPASDVRHYMTSDPVTAQADTPVRKLARRMLDAMVKRVIVVDGQSRPIGVVSTTDLLAALAFAEN